QDNLAREGIDVGRVRFVGNTMIDSLRRFEAAARRRAVWHRYEVEEREYTLVTLHRPSNVDHPARLAGIVNGLCALATEAPVLFPAHPRTRARLVRGSSIKRLEKAGVRCMDPVGYLDFLSLETGAATIVTDSGGVQEEASALGVPCFTLRACTERPITISRGTNFLLGDDPERLRDVTVSRRRPIPCTIPLWDGHAADRAADAILTAFNEVVEFAAAPAVG